MTKAFDTLNCEVEEKEGGGYQREGLGWKILEKMGFPRRVSGVLKDMYCHIKRRFKIEGNLGEPFLPEGRRGVVQGCSLDDALQFSDSGVVPGTGERCQSHRRNVGEGEGKRTETVHEGQQTNPTGRRKT